jgi:hypothetical protein
MSFHLRFVFKCNLHMLNMKITHGKNMLIVQSCWINCIHNFDKIMYSNCHFWSRRYNQELCK